MGVPLCDEARAQHRMRKVGDRLVYIRDRVTLRDFAVPKAGDLREDKPNPMRLLATGAELCHRRGVAPLLSVYKALEGVGVRRFGVHAEPRTTVSPLQVACIQVSDWIQATIFLAR